MSAVIESFKGKWTETSAENFEEFMKALGELFLCAAEISKYRSRFASQTINRPV